MSARQAFFLSIGGAGFMAYLGLLLLVSLSSRELVLAPGEPIRFCGFYLDCHLSAAVEGVRVAPLPEGGDRYTVQVRFASNAVRATLTLENPTARLRDDLGRSVAAASGPGRLRLAADTSITTEFVFDASETLVNPRLQIRKGGLVERLSELFLIGDPDSMLHAPVTLALR